MIVKLFVVFVLFALKFFIMTISTRARTRNNVLYNLIANAFEALFWVIVLIFGVEELMKRQLPFLHVAILAIAGAIVGSYAGQKSGFKIERRIKAFADAFNIKNGDEDDRKENTQ